MVYQPNKKLAFVTGSSRGIGKALAEKLLAEGYQVVGLSRNTVISHSNYTHCVIDLCNQEEVLAFDFAQYVDNIPEQILLVNNAGMIGSIFPVGALTDETIHAVMQVNSIAPQILMNKFLKAFSGKVNHGHILNISSGAGKYPIDAWATYCASKAALDLFSKTVKEELAARSVNGWFIHSVAPGVVDTAMQSEIRSADPGAFKEIEKFKLLKQENQLSDPSAVSEKLYQIIENPLSFSETLLSVRDF